MEVEAQSVSNNVHNCANEMSYLTFEELDSWLSSLADDKRELIEAQINIHKKRIQDLQQGIRQKLAELRALRYDRRCSPDTLPTLGLELQDLRSKLAKAYQDLSDTLTRYPSFMSAFSPRHCFKMK